jgi:2-polyprenyl-6-methoxyphenol hydroxylase-like FAD-dependent oxidoreductase
VVGAGPVGLTLAGEMHRHGVPCRLVERAEAPCPDSRATDMQPRTLEILQDMGLVDEALLLGHPHRGVSMYSEGRWVARFDFEGLDSPYPYALGIPQDVTELLLLRHLERLGGSIERRVEVARVEPKPDGAIVTLLHPDGRWEKTRPRWIIGCDGASSAVRCGLGLPFEGSSYEESFLMADVRLDWEQRHDHISIFYGADCFLLVLPLPGEKRARLFLNEPEGTTLPLTLETFRELFPRACPLPAKLDQPGWMSRFRIHKRLVPSYRVGNVFLAGDAAHIHSPVGGQGMNLGMQDAYNLAWKLALVARGRAPETLLDSYEPERRPLAVAVLDDSDRQQKSALIQGTLGRAVRDNIFQIITRFPNLFKKQRDAGAQIGFNYRGSPIVSEQRPRVIDAHLLEDRTTESPSFGAWRDFASAPAAGDRAPDLRFGEDTLYHRLRGTHHTLLLFDGRAVTSKGYETLSGVSRAIRARYGDLIRPVVVVYGDKVPPELSGQEDVWLDGEGLLHARFGATSECLYLVRPDGYVGHRSQPADLASLEKHLESVLRASVRVFTAGHRGAR